MSFANQFCPQCLKLVFSCICDKSAIGGTDGIGQAEAKVIPLFGDRKELSQATLQSKQDVMELLERLLLEVASGVVTGIAVVAFMGNDQFKCGTSGKMRYTAALGGLEDLKYQVLRQGPSYK